MSTLARGMNRVYGVPNRHAVHQRLRGFAVLGPLAAALQSIGRPLSGKAWLIGRNGANATRIAVTSAGRMAVSVRPDIAAERSLPYVARKKNEGGAFHAPW